MAGEGFVPPVPVPPPGPPIPWRQHLGEVWRGGLRTDVVKVAVVLAVPALAAGLLVGGKKLLAWWKAR